VTEPQDTEDEITEEIPRKRAEPPPKSDLEDWLNWFLGGI
jgi:hypothetical protein